MKKLLVKCTYKSEHFVCGFRYSADVTGANPTMILIHAHDFPGHVVEISVVTGEVSGV